jgi:hypothetical protein
MDIPFLVCRAYLANIEKENSLDFSTATPTNLEGVEGAASGTAPSGKEATLTVQPASDAQSKSEQLLEKNYKELCKWVDTKQVEYVRLFAGREARAGRYASAIKVCA